MPFLYCDNDKFLSIYIHCIFTIAEVMCILNYVWAVMIIIAVLCAVFTGSTDVLTDNVLSAGSDAITLCLKLTGVMCLWCGIMNIAEKSGLCRIVSKFLAPLLKIIMPSLKNNSEALESVTMNVTANLLGLGNAATPMGIRAVEKLRTINNSSDSVTRDIAVFTVMNTSAIRLVPSTAAALREAAGSDAPMEIIFCVWISSALALTAAVASVIMTWRFVKK